MKKLDNKNTIWLTALSICVCGIFILLAYGSGDPEQGQDVGKLYTVRTKHMGGDVYESTKVFTSGVQRVTTGKQDKRGLWQGEVTISGTGTLGEPYYTRTGKMIDGKFHGPVLYTNIKENYTKQEYYEMGREKYDYYYSSYKKSTSDKSAFQILNEEHHIELSDFWLFEFDSDYVKAFLDTLEIMLYEENFHDSLFDSRFDDVLYDLEDTHYDSIIVVNSELTLYAAIDLFKYAEFRLATFDRFLLDAKSTFDIVETKYKGYLEYLIDNGAIKEDVEIFFHVIDSCIDSGSKLDIEDPFFTDSVDTRMYKAISFMLSEEDSSNVDEKSLKIASAYVYGGGLRGAEKAFKHELEDSNPFEDATSLIVITALMPAYYDANVIHKVVEEAFMLRREIMTLPTITTSIADTIPEGIVIHGEIIKDGGAEITSKGISIATVYNPTIEDNLSQQNSDDFIVNSSGLTEGTTYFARAYATNSEGTAYGNCIEFVHSTFVNINENLTSGNNLQLYPNPAADNVMLSIDIRKEKRISVEIINVNGQLVLNKELGVLSQGNNKFEMNITSLPSSMYYCILKEKGNIIAKQKLIILE